MSKKSVKKKLKVLEDENDEDEEEVDEDDEDDIEYEEEEEEKPKVVEAKLINESNSNDYVLVEVPTNYSLGYQTPDGKVITQEQAIVDILNTLKDIRKAIV